MAKHTFGDFKQHDKFHEQRTYTHQLARLYCIEQTNFLTLILKMPSQRECQWVHQRKSVLLIELPSCEVQPPPLNTPGTAPYTADIKDGGPGAITPTRKDHRVPPGVDSKRRQTLLTLLDALTELQKGDDGFSGERNDRSMRRKKSLTTDRFAICRVAFASEARQGSGRT